MPEEQFSFGFDPAPSTEPSVPPDLRDEIARAWSLPLGERAEIAFRAGELDAITGTLELVSAPDFPWNVRQPLQLRVAGFVFSSRDIARWTRQ